MTIEAMQHAFTSLRISKDACEYDRLYRERAIKSLGEAIAQYKEPFGYFRAEPFGWTDCAPNDEGAKALYEHPAGVPHPAAEEHVPEAAFGSITRQPAPDSTGLAVVDTLYHWRPIDASTQRGAKLQLINRTAGVATYGALGTDPGHWTHWAPLPTFGDCP